MTPIAVNVVCARKRSKADTRFVEVAISFEGALRHLGNLGRQDVPQVYRQWGESFRRNLGDSGRASGQATGLTDKATARLKVRLGVTGVQYHQGLLRRGLLQTLDEIR